ncbi:MAG: hypothetical protein ACTSUE_05300 [Promethearchaeota archaeon]
MHHGPYVVPVVLGKLPEGRKFLFIETTKLSPVGISNRLDYNWI